MTPANATFVVSGATGETTATFDVGAEQILRAVDTRLIGGCVPAVGTGGAAPDCPVFNGGATTVTIVYRTVIQHQFSTTYPSGDQSVDHGDRLSNTVNAQADLLSVVNVTTPTGTKSRRQRRRRHDSLWHADQDDLRHQRQHQLRHRAPGAWRHRDLPAALYAAIERHGAGHHHRLPAAAGALRHRAGRALHGRVADAAVPAAGTAKFGPLDSFYALSGSVPTITVDAAGNAVAFAYPAFDDPCNTPTAIDILFTVTG